MAEALVGGSILSAFLQVLFDRIASPQLLHFFTSRTLNHSLLINLQSTLLSLHALLNDAEDKKTSTPPVKLWLDHLKHALYDADDVLDYIAYETLRFQIENNENQVRSFFTSLNLFKKSVVEDKLLDLYDRIEHLVKQKDVLGLKECVFGETTSFFNVPTTSLIDESGVFGRDGEKEAVMEMLICMDDDGGELCVIPIIGMGGIGKTTLAQLVYNDRRLEGVFEIRAWVYVSGEFDVFKITKDIVEEVSGRCCEIQSPNQIQLELKGRLMGKKFLIVLDDVWNDKFTDWEILLRPLKSGANGSKIIVTTRNESVSSVMRTFPPVRLKELNDDHCWMLFVRHAYGNENCPNLEVIRREVVGKCKGLPLAAKALGILLRDKREIDEWERILKSNLWDLTNDNILPALRLSYHYLPSHLKRCFAYCAIFPQDYEFKEEELVLLWMAEGFLEQPKGKRAMEVVGRQYFHDLVSRSFFQRSSVDPSCFVMHDLMNELAKCVSEEFCLVWEGVNASKTVEKVRHLSYVTRGDVASQNFEKICGAKYLRSFLSLGNSPNSDIEVRCDLISNLRSIRVLYLPYCNIIDLPDSIGELKHLRYLNLTASSIKRLPETVDSLYNMQTLILFQCKDLIELPSKMGRLINLQYIDIRGTKVQGMPAQMGRLTKLYKLTDFVLGKQVGSSITELGKLYGVQGELCIWNLQNVTDTQDAMLADLKGKKDLKKLGLRWEGDTDSSVHDRVVLEHLRPHTNLQTLLIFGYGGTRFPDWIEDNTFSNIVSLTLADCNYCTSLPSLGQLASLKDLSIIEFPRIVSISLNFYGSSTNTRKAFRSLRVLRFERMLDWHVWDSEFDEGECFPLLQELYIKDCPNISRVVPSNLPSLIKVNIEGCQQLKASLPKSPTILKMDLADDSRDILLEKCPRGHHRLIVARAHSFDYLIEGIGQSGGLLSSLAEIEIIDCELLNCFPLHLFPKLETLRLSRCRNLQSFHPSEEINWDLTCLQSLEIRECESFVSFPLKGLPAANLEQLILWDCSNLKSLPKSMHSLLPSLVSLEMGNCPVVTFPEEGLPSRLESLDVESCNKLLPGCLQWDLQALQCLSRFRISTHDDVELFPGKMLLPSTLTSLGVWNLQNLKCLNYEGIQHLTSLTDLVIWDCPKLESLPEGGFPSSLSSLCIWKCPLLKERCQRENGKDWPKISSIPYVEIDSSGSSVQQKIKQVSNLPQLKY